MVDLGLSVAWAGYNIGAKSPQDFGNYYSWGERYTKGKYTTENCTTFDKAMADISGNPSFDVARTEWKGKWRIPTKEEIEELMTRCEWKGTVYKNVPGWVVTGPNYNKIFIPCGGWKSEDEYRGKDKNCSFWSSTPTDDNKTAFILQVVINGPSVLNEVYRSSGHNIRPVCDL